LRLRDNFDGREPTFNRETTRDARDFVLNLKAGETLVGTLAKPSQLSPEPTDSIDVSKRLERIEQLHAAKMQK